MHIANHGGPLGPLSSALTSWTLTWDVLRTPSWCQEKYDACSQLWPWATTPISVSYFTILRKCEPNMVRNFKLCSFCLCGNETCADATGRFNRPNASSTPAEYLLTHATCKSCLNWYDFSHMYFKRHALSLQLFLLTSSSTNMDNNDDNSTTGKQWQSSTQCCNMRRTYSSWYDLQCVWQNTW